MSAGEATEIVFLIFLAVLFFGAAGALIGSRAFSSGRPFWSLAHFTSHLAAAVRRNLPLGQAIEAYAADLPKLAAAAKRAMLRTIAWEVDNGRPLSEVMGAYPGVFPEPYRALVRAGERSGSLAGILTSLREMAELDDSTGRRAAAAAIYPATLAILLTGPAAFMAVHVIPSFHDMFHELSIPEIKVNPSLFFLGGVAIPLLALLLGTLFAALLLKGASLHLVDRLVPRVRLWAAALRWRLPLWSRYERRRAAGSFSLAAGKLLEAGVPEVEALGIAAGASGSARFEGIALRAAARVAEGQPLSRALEAEDPRGELPPELLWHVRLGEAAGDLPAALSRAAAAALARAGGALRRMIGLIFPVGVVAVGAVVWLMAYSVFGTLVTVMDSLSSAVY